MNLQSSVQPITTGVFDWYQCTTDAKINQFQDEIKSSYDDADWQIVRATNNYHHGAQLVRGDLVLATALWGGPNGDNVHAYSSGFEARRFSSVIREKFPSHRVTRADCAVDFIESDSWNSIEKLTIHVAETHKVKLQHIGDFHFKKDGRTLNLGGQKSDVRATVYEKGIQLGESPDWVRAEVKVKPPKPNKELRHFEGVDARVIASKLTPLELWGCSKWSGDLLTQLTGEIMPSISMRAWTKSDHDKARLSMIKQYKNVLIKLREDCGSSSAAGSQIYYELDQILNSKNV